MSRFQVMLKLVVSISWVTHSGTDLSWNMAVRISQVGLQWTLHRFGWPFSLRFCDCSQQSRFQTARRCHEKISFAINFGHNSFVLDDVNLAELSNNSFVSKDVTFFFFFGGSKYTLTPPTYFQWGIQSWSWVTFSKPNPIQHKISGPNPTQPNQPMDGPNPWPTLGDQDPISTARIYALWSRGYSGSVNSRLSEQQKRRHENRTCCDEHVVQSVDARTTADRGRRRPVTSETGRNNRSARYVGRISEMKPMRRGHLTAASGAARCLRAPWALTPPVPATT